MNIKRMLKKQANEMLPDEQLKNNIRDMVVSEKEVVYANNNGTTTSTKRNINIVLITFSVLAVVCILATLLGLFLPKGNVSFDPVNELLNGQGYVNIQINPGFEIMVDGQNRVTSIKATNKDGALVLYGTNYVGMPLEKACNRIMKDSDALGFIHDDNKAIEVIAFNEDKAKSEQLGIDVKGGLNSYLYGSIYNNKSVNIISNSRDTIEQIAINKGLNSNSVKTMKVSDIAREVTNYNEKVVTKVNNILDTKLASDETYKLLEEELEKIDKLEDAIDEITDYLEDYLEVEEDDDDDDEENEFDPQELKRLIDVYNSYAVGCFEDYNYNLTIDLTVATKAQLQTVFDEFLVLYGDDDKGTGIDALEDSLEEAFNKYKLEHFGTIDIDEDDD